MLLQTLEAADVGHLIHRRCQSVQRSMEQEASGKELLSLQSCFGHSLQAMELIEALILIFTVAHTSKTDVA